MSVTERIIFFAIGSGFGFIFGYIVRSLTCIQKDTAELKEAINIKKKEAGLARYPLLLDITLAIIVALTAYSAFQSQVNSNDVKNTQEQQTVTTNCNKKFLARTVEALNERTTFAHEQAVANLNLQKDQAQFLNLLLSDPPPTRVESREAFTDYVTSLTNFVEVSAKSINKIVLNPFPTVTEINACLDGQRPGA